MSIEGIEKSTVFEPESEINYSPKAIVSRIIQKSQAGNVTLFAFDEGQGLSEHTAPFDAQIQVIDGSAEVTIGGKMFVVSKGQAIVMPANIPHALHAPGKFKMILTMIRG